MLDINSLLQIRKDTLQFQHSKYKPLNEEFEIKSSHYLQNFTLLCSEIESKDTLHRLNKLLEEILSLQKDEILNEKEAREKLCTFLAIRWSTIKQTGTAYAEDFNNPANEACIKLAKLLDEENYLQILMPTIHNIESLLTYNSSQDVVQNAKELGQFFPLITLSDPDESSQEYIIEIVACLQQYMETGELLHTSKLDKNSKFAKLSDSEAQRVINHSNGLFELIKKLLAIQPNEQIDNTIKSKLSEFVKGLEDGSVNSTKKGGGSELIAGDNANKALVQLSTFLDYLKEKNSDLYQQLMKCTNASDSKPFYAHWDILSDPQPYNFSIYPLEVDKSKQPNVNQLKGLLGRLLILDKNDRLWFCGTNEGSRVIIQLNPDSEELGSLKKLIEQDNASASPLPIKDKLIPKNILQEILNNNKVVVKPDTTLCVATRATSIKSILDNKENAKILNTKIDGFKSLSKKELMQEEYEIKLNDLREITNYSYLQSDKSFSHNPQDLLRLIEYLYSEKLIDIKEISPKGFKALIGLWSLTPCFDMTQSSLCLAVLNSVFELFTKESNSSAFRNTLRTLPEKQRSLYMKSSLGLEAFASYCTDNNQSKKTNNKRLFELLHYVNEPDTITLLSTNEGQAVLKITNFPRGLIKLIGLGDPFWESEAAQYCLKELAGNTEIFDALQETPEMAIVFRTKINNGLSNLKLLKAKTLLQIFEQTRESGVGSILLDGLGLDYLKQNIKNSSDLRSILANFTHDKHERYKMAINMGVEYLLMLDNTLLVTILPLLTKEDCYSFFKNIMSKDNLFIKKHCEKLGVWLSCFPEENKEEVKSFCLDILDNGLLVDNKFLFFENKNSTDNKDKKNSIENISFFNNN